MGEGSGHAEGARSRTGSGTQEDARILVKKASVPPLSVHPRTNAILYYIKDDVDAVAALRRVFAQNTPIYVSAITELELFAFTNLTSEDESLIEELLATISVISVDSRVARLAALVRRRYRLKVPDSVIAATAMFTGSTLLTRHTRDFRNIPNLTVLKV